MVSREFKAVFAASALSWFGDHAARAAVTALVLVKTDSVAYSAATFAISYLPWLGIGNVLSAMAERYSYRQVMIVCDVVRMALMTLIAVISMPVPALMGLLFLTALLNPPFDAARSALLPKILEGDRYIVGLSLQRSAGQGARIVGYVAGAGIAGVDARMALLFNAFTFAVSAVAVWLGVRERPPALRTDQRTGLLRETAEGFSVVYRNPVLRAIALVVFGSAAFTVAPEGLAAAWAVELTSSTTQRGWYQGAIMMSNASGFVLGSIIIGRFVSPSTRISLIRPLSVICTLVLVPAVFQPNLWVIVAMNVASGFALAGLMPASNGLFVRALPDAFRARAFGVMQSGMLIVQGVAIFATGWLSDRIPLPYVIGGWSAFGVVTMMIIVLAWPNPATIADTIAAAREAQGAGERERLPAGRHRSRNERRERHDETGHPSGLGPVRATARLSDAATVEIAPRADGSKRRRRFRPSPSARNASAAAGSPTPTPTPAPTTTTTTPTPTPGTVNAGPQ
jgi:predicted MFS family arabinose efflux permease